MDFRPSEASAATTPVHFWDRGTAGWNIPASAMLALLLSAPTAAQMPSAAYRFEPLLKTPADLARRVQPDMARAQSPQHGQ
jgi:hypothetical protein